MSTFQKDKAFCETQALRHISFLHSSIYHLEIVLITGGNWKHIHFCTTPMQIPMLSNHSASGISILGDTQNSGGYGPEQPVVALALCGSKLGPCELQLLFVTWMTLRFCDLVIFLPSRPLKKPFSAFQQSCNGFYMELIFHDNPSCLHSAFGLLVLFLSFLILPIFLPTKKKLIIRSNRD